jgi:pilus assembly protein CpaF
VSTAAGASVLRLAQSLATDPHGFGPLAPLLGDVTVTDITVNGPGEVWADRGDGMQRTAIRFPDEVVLRRFAARLASSVGRRLDDASPFVDAPLPHGVRLHAVLPPIVEQVTVTLRVPRHRVWSLADLVTSGMVPVEAEPLLRRVLAARASFLISGGTGTGKTTLLNALLGEVDPCERLVVVEDTRELAPRHPHVVRAQTRPPNIEGAGEVTLQHLVRQTLRMRPDRIVVGEVRGAEVVDLLTALNTGHAGGCSTLHANSAVDVVARLEALGALGGLSRFAVTRLVAAAVQVVVHLERNASGCRRMATLGLVERSGDDVTVVPAFTASDVGRLRPDVGATSWSGRFAEGRALP